MQKIDVKQSPKGVYVMSQFDDLSTESKKVNADQSQSELSKASHSLYILSPLQQHPRRPHLQLYLQPS